MLAREIGGVGPFVSPSADPAPWYDAAVPESAEFLGLYVVDLDFQSVDVRRSVSQRFSAAQGGVIGFEQVGARLVKVRAYLVASSCPGMEYGRHWVYSKLGADCSGCSLGMLRVRDSCPPDDGSDDTRGEWIIYDAALIEGITRNDNPGFPCCDYDPIEFTLAGESPYLYKRAGASTSAVEVQSNGAIAPPAPAVLDTMVRANTGPPPSASWTGIPVSNFTNNLRIVSNQLDNASATNIAGAYWNAATFGPDVIVSVVMTTRTASGDFYLLGRLTTPGTATGKCVYLRVQNGASPGTDVISIGRISAAGALNAANAIGGQTFANGDTFSLICRGGLIEAWRTPSGGATTRLLSAYDATPAIASNVGVAIGSLNAVGQRLGAFSAGTLTNGVYPVDPIVVPIPATGIGVTSPIITITGGALSAVGLTGQNVVNDARIQVKQYPACSQSDNFTTNDLATNWYAAVSQYTISGGKLRPLATGTLRPLQRSYDGTVGNRVEYLGGRVEAQVTLGATLTNGAWGVTYRSGADANLAAFGAFIVAGTNIFTLAPTPTTTPSDSVSFTPIASHTYRIILEVLTTATTGSYDVRAYLVDQAAPTVMLTRPLRATVVYTLLGATTFVPTITSIPADTNEAWDTFYAIDYAAEPAYLDVSIPRGVITIDASRRVATFVPAGTASSLNGSQYLSTPIGTPLGWPEVCAGTGPGCLQVFGGETLWLGTTVSVALQSRTR